MKMNTLFKNYRVNKKITGEFLKYLKTDKNKNTTYQN